MELDYGGYSERVDYDREGREELALIPAEGWTATQ